MIHTLKVSIHSRGKGHSATAGIAYRVGANLIDLDANWHNFSRRKPEVIEHGLAGGDFDDPQEWAHAIEATETRKNSQLYRDVQLGLPHELDEDKQIRLAREWAGAKAAEYGTSACWAVHRPSEEGDGRNTHAHILLATRTLTTTRSFAGGKKIRSIDAATLKRWHGEWDVLQKQACANAGVEYEPIPDPEFHPGLHLGPEATALERAAAEKESKEREKAKEEEGENAPEEPVHKRRSVRELLTYTKGVTVRGREWLTFDRLIKAVRSAQQRLERTREEITEWLAEWAEAPAQPAVERDRDSLRGAILGTAEPAEPTAVEPADATTAKSSASAPRPEAPAPVPQPDRRRKRRRRKRAHAEDKSPTPKPQQQPDPTLLDAYEAGWSDAHEAFAKFVAWLPREDGKSLWTDYEDWTGGPSDPGESDPAGDTHEAAYDAGDAAGHDRVDQYLDSLPMDIQVQVRESLLDWKRRGQPTGEPRDELDNNAGSASGLQP